MSLLFPFIYPTCLNSGVLLWHFSHVLIQLSFMELRFKFLEAIFCYYTMSYYFVWVVNRERVLTNSQGNKQGII